ncbi:hypothetical protein GRI43_03790 [Altererythrobacter luteolus]|uniref:Uncharacterized protein n=1 Tax=Pontixanthobacter luteolus TaxID=295089 RepID=A0A6I4UXA8_9SPHN|nr:tetratricopeptide repeat protein [Pontixanthobacter luteolus]MXP46517.1 hypothetical protein [Pontixanthobacter luteolus]
MSARRLRHAAIAIAAALIPAAGVSASDNPGLDAYMAGDLREATQLWRSACEEDNATGCYHLGVVYRDGEGVKRSNARASELFEKACDLGSGKACFNRSLEAASSASDPDFTKQIRFLHRGCDLGSMRSCANLAGHYLHGKGLEKNVPAGISLLDASCVSGERSAGSACFTLSAVFDGHGNMVQIEDPVRANHWLNIGCGYVDLDSCTNLGFHYRTGYGVPRDMVRANALYAIACNDGDGLQCPMYSPNEYFGGGSPYEGGNVKARLLPVAGLYSDACDAGLAHGCSALAYAIMRSRSAAASEGQVRSLLDRSVALLPENWFAKWLLNEVETTGLKEWDRRNRFKD